MYAFLWQFEETEMLTLPKTELARTLHCMSTKNQRGNGIHTDSWTPWCFFVGSYLARKALLICATGSIRNCCQNDMCLQQDATSQKLKQHDQHFSSIFNMTAFCRTLRNHVEFNMFMHTNNSAMSRNAFGNAEMHLQILDLWRPQIGIGCHDRHPWSDWCDHWIPSNWTVR